MRSGWNWNALTTSVLFVDQLEVGHFEIQGGVAPSKEREIRRHGIGRQRPEDLKGLPVRRQRNLSRIGDREGSVPNGGVRVVE